MKTLKAKGAVTSKLQYLLTLNVMLMMMAAFAWLWHAGILIVLVVIIILYYIDAVLGIMNTYRQNCIMYGDGKIIIRHGRIKTTDKKERKNKEWKYEEDEILPAELEAYSVVYYHGKIREYATVVSFQPKDGERKEYALGYYSREQLDELFRYIYEESGMEVQVAAPD